MNKLLLLFMIVSLTGFQACKNANSVSNGNDIPVAAEASEMEDFQTEQADATVDNRGTLVTITTEYGVLTVRLYDETPLHRDNFIKLVKAGFYDNLLFHRVIANFMIQGGDPDSRNAQPGQPLGTGGPGYTIPAEIVPGLFHKKGALAAARLGDAMNPSKASSGSQFYLVQGKVYTEQELAMMQQQGLRLTPEQRTAYTTVGGTPHLDNGYTVFGEVIRGLEVIDAIAAVQTAPGDRPLKDVRMTMQIVVPQQ